MIPNAMAQPELRAAHAHVGDEGAARLDEAEGDRRLYTDVATGEEYEQPAAIVALCAYAINNVHLLLLSGIGTPYDPATQKGIVGRNYCYQPGGGGVTLFFEDKIFNPFMATGAFGIGARRLSRQRAVRPRGRSARSAARRSRSAQSNGRPIGYRPVPAGTPRWGAEWKKATAKWYLRSMNIGVTASNMPNRYNAYDLDPDLPERVRPAAAAADLQLPRQRQEGDRASSARRRPRSRGSMNADEHERAWRARRLLHRAVPVDAQHGRRHHGHDAARQRRQPVPAELGRPERVRRRRERVPAQLGLQPDRPGRRAGVLDGRRDQDAVSAAARGCWPDDAGRVAAGWRLAALAALIAAGAQTRSVRPTRSTARRSSSKCAACHSLDGRATTDGPTLKGVIGRKAGSLDDYRYSAAMKRSDVTWDAATLDAFITDPQALHSGEPHGVCRHHRQGRARRSDRVSGTDHDELASRRKK